ncbi:SMI1/KNR4 family protein [Cronobacter turicensis]|uniref:SMI1/KNR4 family protein n=1 Tax=Cronobacter turicensis TaxID=413502 RepID=UPI000CFAA5D6|nr:SMI1/KNR4 family protein [Cronobacter turicensis]EGT4493906.1 SMI1/KNR4 family protein [Cronobacter turicensis]EKM0439686.1 SMI1/KNR4 family protein [Cronobacter turicensis]ELY4323523.1 SMI1/KNR4 family protein [Cronobacter turicensis]ELY4609803.1 SMI1/KNR4 family protein [Cronobacter turicensis]ELY5944829.1 SMI1/KNR4 family protein [Cronobacter turicensis]
MPVSCGKMITEADIQRLENRYRISLPEDYKTFLLLNNGFVVKSPDYCNLTYRGVDEGAIAFNALFGMQAKNDYYDVIYNNDELLSELDFIDSKLIIGDDPGGNYFLMVDEQNRKGIFYWDRTHLHAEDTLQQFEIPEQDECGNLYRLSDTFTAFFEMISGQTLAHGMHVNRDL